MGMPGGMELFVLVAVVVLLFGGKKIPELAKGMGQGIKNFKSAMKEDEEAPKTAEAKTNPTEKIEEETVTASTSTESEASKTETKTV